VNSNLEVQSKKIPAVCVPYIRTRLDITGLQDVARRVSFKGYTLADNELQNGGDTITNINFIFGASAMYCIPSQTISFGNKCMVYDTPIGMMLIGKVDGLLENVRNSLPARNEYPKTELNSFSTTEKHLDETSRKTEYEDSSNIDYYFVEEGDRWSESINFCVIKENGEVMYDELKRATESTLTKSKSDILNERSNNYLKTSCLEENTDEDDEVNSELIQKVLTQSYRNDEGRLVMPILWNNKNVYH